MIKLGVTGGIGSGKSIVCEVLRLHDIPVYNADCEAKNLNDTSPVIREKLTRIFGPELYKNDKLDREKLAHIIFGNEENRRAANSIIHPELARHFAAWIQQRTRFPIVCIEAAVLFESGFHRFVDRTITVLAPIETRVRRVAKRDNLPVGQIELRIKSQMSDEERIKLSDFIVFNDDRRSVLEQVSKILQIISRPS